MRSVEDRDGSIRFGTEAGLFHVHDASVTHVRLAGGMTGTVVRAVHEDRDGAVWVGTAAMGFLRLTEGRVRAGRPGCARALPVVSAIHEDRDGTMWLGTDSGQLLSFGASGIRAGEDGRNSAGSVRALRRDRDGNLWIATLGAVWCE